MHPLHDYVAKQLAEKLKSQEVVVWYDARREFAPFVDEVRGGARTGERAGARVGRRHRRAPRRVRGLDVRAARGRRAARERRRPGVGRDLPAGLRARPPRLGADGAREGRTSATSRSSSSSPGTSCASGTPTASSTRCSLPTKVTYEDLARASSDTSSAEPPSILKRIFHDTSRQRRAARGVARERCARRGDRDEGGDAAS